MLCFIRAVCYHCRYVPCASLLVRLEHVKASQIHYAKTSATPDATTIPNYNTGYNSTV